MGRKLVHGVGVNDADYQVCPTVNGRQVMCYFYCTWKAMLARCCSTTCQSKHPTYAGCTVQQEWLTFSNFKKWMEKQEWQGMELDKDLLVKGNKIYSPDNCVFVDRMTNSFTTDSAATRGDWPVGVHMNKWAGMLQARCHNPFIRARETLGYFDCPNEAHAAWRKRKHEIACQLADLQADQRVAEALRIRYL